MRAFAAVLAVTAVLTLTACGSLSKGLRDQLNFTDTMLNLHLDERDYDMDMPRDFRATTLARLRENPSAFMGLNVSFQAIFASHDEGRDEASYTGLRLEKFYNFSVWNPGTKIWTEEGFTSSINTIYVSKENKYLTTFRGLRPYQVVDFRGKVVSDFNGEVWIKCYYVDAVTGKTYNHESLKGLVRGLQEVKSGNSFAAMKAFESAETGTLPDGARHMVHLELGRLYHARAGVSKTQSDYAKAVSHFQSAANLDSESSEAKIGLANAERDYNRQIEIDRKAPEEAARREEEARKMRESEAARKSEEAAMKKKEEEDKKKMEEEARKKEEEKKKMEEEERKRKEEEARKKKEEEDRLKTEEERRKAEEARKKKEEEDRKKREEEARKMKEEEARKKKEEEDRKKREEEARKKKEEEDRKKREAEANKDRAPMKMKKHRPGWKPEAVKPKPEPVKPKPEPVKPKPTPERQPKKVKKHRPK